MAIEGRRLPADTLQGVHLGIQYGTATLDPAVVAAANDLAGVHDDRADGYPALGQTLAGFFDRGLEKLVHVLALITAS
jgi:hypothetical protein